MNIQQTIETNRRILKLIEAKYDGYFPLNYTTPEANYYRRLKQDTDIAQARLRTLQDDEAVEKEAPCR